MPDEGPRCDSSIAAPDRSRWWRGILCLPRKRFGLARLACAFGLFALLISALFPADDSVQPDFSRHFRNGHRVTASTLLQTGHLFTRNWTAAAVTFGAHAGPVRHPADHSIHGLPTRLISPGFEGPLAARAPPACSSLAV
jgi:hypothetical protein